MNRKSLVQADIKHMLKLQELFYNRFLNQQLLNQLISLYVKAIDCCSEKINLMKIYFLQKMQFLVSRPQIQMLLIEKYENQETSTKDKYTIKISKIEFEYETPQYVRKSSLHSQPISPKLIDIKDQNQKIRQRDNRIQIQLQMLKQIESNTIQTTLQKWKVDKNNKITKKMDGQAFDDQEIDIKEILAKRPNKMRKNSDDLKVQKQLNLILDGKIIDKKYLLENKKQLQQKLQKISDRLNRKTGQFKKVAQIHDFKRGRIKLKSEYKHQYDDQIELNCQVIEQASLQLEGRSQFYGSSAWESFAPGHNTPEFSEQTSCYKWKESINDQQIQDMNRETKQRQTRQSEYQQVDDQYF